MNEQRILSQEFKEKIANALEKKGALKFPCPRCGGNDFDLADGIDVPILQNNALNLALSGSALPCVLLTCSRCGFVSLHSIGVLGLMGEVTANGNA